jgi:hypothetical protein
MLAKLILAGILAVSLASAQRGGGRGSGAAVPDMPMGGRLDKIAILTDNLKLNKDQKKLVKTTLDEEQKEAAALREQVVKSRMAIGEAVAAGKSQAEIDGLVRSHAALESQMAGFEMKAFSKIYQGLDKDQQSRAGQVLFPMMIGIFKNKSWND